jgi:Tol biopolymer transport system component
VTIPIGARLGPYEVLSPLGAGGMGEVYKARDTRLERTVAVKVLPQHLSSSSEVRQRFEREAKTISQLSHPHICALYDAGNQDGVEYLVMELLEGETLAERLVRGPLPPDQTLRFGSQIASALDAAHRKGIVHRDLKPSNVMLTKTGVKLLDFGLAKVLAPVSTLESLTSAPTAAKDMTRPGMVLGTVPYMAPEQLQGKDADSRGDIFALGAVLYEMATGRKAFEGASPVSIMSAILTSEPPLVSSVQPASPAALDRLVRTCLAKDPDDRWQTARDVELQLAAIAEGSSAPPATLLAGRPALSRWLPWLVAGAALAIAVVATLRKGPPAPPRPIRFTVAPPQNGAFSYSLEGAFLAVSPDGSQIAYIASEAQSDRRIYLRPFSSLEARPIPGTEGARSLFWSPDGRTIGFFAETALKRVEPFGGSPVSICDIAPGIGFSGTWGQGGDIVFASILGEAIYRVSAAGGAPAVLLRPDRSREASVNWPWFLPDGKRFLYLSRDLKWEANLMLAEPGRSPTVVMPAASNVQYADPGYLVFAREGALLALRFDPRNGRTTGEPFSIAGHVRYFLTTRAAAFALSRAGTLAYQSQEDVKRLVWFDRTGRRLATVGPPGRYLNVRISPDGRWALFDRARESTGTLDVWSVDLERGTETPITSEPNSEFAALLLPGEKSIAYSASRGRGPRLLRRDLATGRDEELVPEEQFFCLAQDVSPDGMSFVYTRLGEGGVFNVWMLPLSGGGKATALLESAFNKREVRFSPDGRFLAMISNESGRSEVYVTRFPGPGERVRVSTGGARHLQWSHDGRELFYISSDQRLIAVPVRTSPALELGIATPLFSLLKGGVEGGLDRGITSGFDVSADGQRFLIVFPEVVGDELPLTIVANWASEAGR